MRILQVVKGPLNPSGISQISLNIAECFAEAGDESYVYIHHEGIHSMYKERIKEKGIRVVGKRGFLKRLFCNENLDSIGSFDLVINHVPRKSWREIPRFEGYSVAFIYTPYCGFQDTIHYCQQFFFPSHWIRKHFLQDGNESWDVARKMSRDRFSVQYPPIAKDAFERKIRTRAGMAGQLTLPRKIDPAWDQVLNTDLQSIIPFKRVSGSIETYERRKQFWSGVDVVIWASMYDEGFGMNLHEAIFSGCVPVLLKRQDGTNELVAEHSAGIIFSDIEELLEAIQGLVDKPGEVEVLSQRALEATEQLAYEHWYKSFMDQINL